MVNIDKAFFRMLKSPASIHQDQNARRFLKACRNGEIENASDLMEQLKEELRETLSLAEYKKPIHNALCKAIFHGYERTVVFMLGIPEIMVHAHLYNNNVLELAIQKNMHTVWRTLKENPLVIAEFLMNPINIEENILLRQAARCGNIEAVQELLKIPAVRENAAVFDNDAIYLALKNGHEALALGVLWPIPVVQQKAHVKQNRLLSLAHRLRCQRLLDQLMQLRNVVEADGNPGIKLNTNKELNQKSTASKNEEMLPDQTIHAEVVLEQLIVFRFNSEKSHLLTSNCFGQIESQADIASGLGPDLDEKKISKKI